MLAFYIAFGFQNLPIKCISNVTIPLLVQFTDQTIFQNKNQKKKKKEVSPFVFSSKVI